VIDDETAFLGEVCTQLLQTACLKAEQVRLETENVNARIRSPRQLALRTARMPERFDRPADSKVANMDKGTELSSTYGIRIDRRKYGSKILRCGDYNVIFVGSLGPYTLFRKPYLF
jgi:hypothetical protein